MEKKTEQGFGQLPDFMVEQFKETLKTCKDDSGNNVLEVADICRKFLDTLELPDHKALVINYLLMQLPLLLQKHLVEAHKEIVKLGMLVDIKNSLGKLPGLEELVKILKNE